ncbi:hypothetical protein AMECASPLE_023321, partial [Ameca splendens]
MARCWSYLRGLSICVTVLLLVSGVVMIGVGYSSIEGNLPVAELFDQLSISDGLLALQVFGPITVVLSVLGISAAASNCKPLLLLICFCLNDLTWDLLLQFSALIFVEFVAVMVVASPLVHVEAQMNFAVDEIFLNVTPLHRADRYIQTELQKLQTSDSCCGLRSFEDWGNHLPDSCSCMPHVDLSSQPSNSSLLGSCVMAGANLHLPDSTTSDKIWVHSEPCGPILKSYLGFPIKLRIGIISAFATIT